MNTQDNSLRNIAGTFLIDATAAFLNGAGTAPGEDKTTTVPKTFREQNGSRKEEVPYVSAQAFRRWLRDTVNEENSWPPSELHPIGISERGSVNKIATELNPIEFPEDDIFGYMRAGSSNEESVQRTTAFKNSILKAIRGKRSINQDDGYVHLKEGTPLPYSTRFYSAYLEGFFNLECYRLGVYDNLGSHVELAKEILEKLTDRLEKETIHKKFNRYTIKEAEHSRRERAVGLLRGLVHLRGGAKQAAFSTDVSPKVIVLAGLTCANPVFNDLFEAHELRPSLKVETLKEIAKDYSSKLTTSIHIGLRNGTLANEEEVLELEQSRNEGVRFVLDSPITVVNKFIEDHLNKEA